MSAYTNVSGVWKGTKPYVKVAGNWVYPLKAYIKNAGSWVNWHLAGAINDDTYNVYDNASMANSSVNTIVVQSDGKILLGGSFTTWNSITVNRIVRLNSDGTRDTAFTTNTGIAANSPVNTIVLQSDGKILLGGSFTTWNGTTVNRIVRLNSNGTSDTVFTTNTGTGANAQVNTSVVQSDGKILFGGSFSTWNGTNVNSIVRLNSDGTRDTAFTTNTGTAGNGQVNTIVLQSDGKILVGGNFTTWNGVTVNRIVRLNSDGTRDTTFTTNTGTGANAQVTTSVVQSDGKILLGGSFSTWNGTNVNYIVRLNSDGTRDTAFTTNTGTAGNGSVTTIVVQSDGKILLGGNFTTWNGTTVNRIVRLNSNGTSDTVFTTNTGTAGDGSVTTIVVQSDGKILVGGNFTTWNGTLAYFIVRLNSDGTRDTSVFNVSFSSNNTVNTVAFQSDSKILLGGTFVIWNGITTNRIVRLNSDGTRDTAFTTNTGTGANGSVTTIVVQPDGKILLGGIFTTWNGVTVNRIVRLNSDGTRDTTFTTNTGTAANGQVITIALQPDGKILVGGSFTTWNGTNVNYIVRLNSDGTRDTTFTTNTGTAANNLVTTIVVQSDGKILVGGNFTTWNGTTVNRIVRLNSDGTRDTAFTTNTGTAAIGTINSIVVQSDGKILLGGGFTTWNGTTVNRIVRLNSDGTRDTAFTTNAGTAADNTVSAIVVQSDGKILLGGSFSTWNGTTVNRIVRLNSDGTRDTAFTTNAGIGADNAVLSIAFDLDGKILIGGSFTTFNNIMRSYNARIGGADAA